MNPPNVTLAYFTRWGAERGRDLAFTGGQIPSMVRVRRAGGLRKWRLEIWL